MSYTTKELLVLASDFEEEVISKIEKPFIYQLLEAKKNIQSTGDEEDLATIQSLIDKYLDTHPNFRWKK
jgi:hypothetical protein